MATLKPAISSAELTTQLERLKQKRDFLTRQKLTEMTSLDREIKLVQQQRRDALQREAKLAAEKAASEAFQVATGLVDELHAASLRLSQVLAKLETAAAAAQNGEISISKAVSRKYLPMAMLSRNGDRIYVDTCLSNPQPDTDQSKVRSLQLLIQRGGTSPE